MQLVLISSLIEPHMKVIVPQLLNPSPALLCHTDTLLDVPELTKIDGFLFQLPTAITGFIHTSIRTLHQLSPPRLESIFVLVELYLLSVSVYTLTHSHALKITICTPADAQMC